MAEGHGGMDDAPCELTLIVRCINRFMYTASTPLVMYVCVWRSCYQVLNLECIVTALNRASVLTERFP
jgi:hypothetical protein